MPLYGRADYRPLLEPLDFRDASLFASPRLSAESKLRRYAGRGALSAAIADRVLSRGESLYEEPLHLLREEQAIRDPGTYFAIVREVAGGRTTVSEISNGTRVSVPNLTKMLRRLVELGYLEARSPLSPQGPEARRTSYRLADTFFRFWFRFVFPNRSLLERGRVKEVLRIVERDKRDGQTEIDIVGTSRGRYDLLASCKWSSSASAAALERLLEQRDSLPRAGGAKLAIFARGFSPGLRRQAEEESVALVGIDRLFGLTAAMKFSP